MKPLYLSILASYMGRSTYVIVGTERGLYLNSNMLLKSPFIFICCHTTEGVSGSCYALNLKTIKTEVLHSLIIVLLYCPSEYLSRRAKPEWTPLKSQWVVPDLLIRPESACALLYGAVRKQTS